MALIQMSENKASRGGVAVKNVELFRGGRASDSSGAPKGELMAHSS